MNPYIIPGLKYRPAQTRNGQYQVIIDAVLDFCGITLQEVTGRSRKRTIVYARHLIMYLMRTSNMKLTEIGDIFNRDHTTVMYANQTIKDQCCVNIQVRQDVKQLQNKIGS